MMKNDKSSSKRALFGFAIVVVVSLVIAVFAGKEACAASDPIKDSGLSKLTKNGVKKILIPSFQVVFKTRSGGTAQSKKSFFGSSSDPEASASMVVTWPGVDKALLQKVADAAYVEFGKKLTEAGFEVVSLSPSAMEVYKKISGSSTPVDGDGFITMMPTGLMIYDPMAKMDPNGGFTMGIFNTNSKGEGDVVKALSSDTAGIAVARVVVVVAYGTFNKDAGNIVNTGTGKTTSASIAFKPQLSIQQGAVNGMTNILTNITFMSNYQEMPGYKMSGYFGKDTSTISLGSELISGTEVGSVKETTTTGEKAGMVALNMLGALAGKGASFSKYEATIDQVAYEKAALEMIGKFAELTAVKIKAAN